MCFPTVLRLPLVAWLAVLVFGVSSAARAATVTGTVDSVDADAGTITVSVLKKDEPQTLTLKEGASITISGKKSMLTDLQAGQSVTLTTDRDNQVTKVVARNAPVARGKAARGTLKTGLAKVEAGDWPQFHGPNRDNISAETGLLDRWPADGPALAWQTEGLGEGYSSVSIVDGRIYTMGNRGNDEVVLCLAAADGKPIWSTRNGAAYREGQGNGPRGTPTVDGEHVYALGANGDLSCLKTADGDVVWQINVLKEFGAGNITWGISESVLIDGDHLICTPGGRSATMVALNKLTGKPVWTAAVPGNPQASYASIIPVEVGGVRQYVNFTHTGVVGVRAADGRALWGDTTAANGTANCSSPVAVDNFVFASSGYGQGAALIQLSANQGGNVNSKLVYPTKEMKNHHGGMVLIKNHLYGSDDPGVLKCLDLKSGKVVWQNRSVGKGALTCADGKLILRSEAGPVALVAASPQGYEELGRFDQPSRSEKPSWSHPVVSHGKLYLRDMDRLLVYNLK